MSFIVTTKRIKYTCGCEIDMGNPFNQRHVDNVCLTHLQPLERIITTENFLQDKEDKNVRRSD